MNLFAIERDGTCPSVSDRIDHNGREVDEPFRAATTELTIQKVDTILKEEELRPDGNRRCYHGEVLVRTFQRKKATSSVAHRKVRIPQINQVSNSKSWMSFKKLQH